MNARQKETLTRHIQETIAGLKADIDAYKGLTPVSYTHLTLPTTCNLCRSRWAPEH